MSIDTIMSKHAYLIIAHKNPRQLIKLIESIDNIRNDIYLHIDKKIIHSFNMTKILQAVHLSSISIIKPINVYWGDVSLIQCEIELIKSALHNGQYDYMHLLSGLDFPLHNQQKVHAFFELHKGKEFVHFSGKAYIGKVYIKERVTHKWHPKWYSFIDNDFFFRLVRKIDLYGFFLENLFKGNNINSHDSNMYYHGSQWFSITDFLAEKLVKCEHQILDRYQHSYCCDEVFLQTFIVENGLFERLYVPKFNNGIESTVRAIDWVRGGPYTFRVNDFEQLISQENVFFARKIDETIDSKLIKKLMEHIRAE